MSTQQRAATLAPPPEADANRALELLYREHAHDVSRYTLAMLGNRAEAEDATQATFLNAYLALRRGEHPRTPRHWLIAIARNTCRERFRHGQRRLQEVELSDDMSALAESDNEAPTIAELQRALLELPAKQRAALVMRELEGRQFAEIARSLGISTSAVATLLFRARHSLREQLDEQLSCREAVAAIAKQVEHGRQRGERSDLRAHLRRCPDCAKLARSLRARRNALRSLLPLSWLSSFLTRNSTSGARASGSSGLTAAGLAAKTGAILATGVIVGGTVSARVTYPGRHGTPQRSNSVPPTSMRTAHDVARPVASVRSSGPAVGAATRRAPVEVSRSLKREPGNHLEQPAAHGPGLLGSGGTAALGGPHVTHTSQGASQGFRSTANRSNGLGAGRPVTKHATAAGLSSHGNGKPAPGVPNSGAQDKVARGQSTSRPRRPTSPPQVAHTNPIVDPTVVPAAQAHGNGPGVGQANRQESVPVGPPAATPGQSSEGGNGHH